MVNKSLFFFVFFLSAASIKVSSQKTAIDSTKISRRFKLKYQSLIVPAGLIGYGVVGIESDAIKSYNAELREEVKEHIDDRVTIDDFSQYVPFLSVYALNCAGIKGWHNFKDRTVILATSYLIMGSTVNSLKSLTNVERPDGSSSNSFPSGHTATAFMGAEFLWQEYKDVSVWYGLSGYLVATGTGLFRVYNNRHWFSDVTAGAGIGILSTKIAYWIHPFINRKLSRNTANGQVSAIVYPTYNGSQVGAGLSLRF